MTGPDRIEWRRSPPTQALIIFCWYAVGAMLVVAAAWLLFGDEPANLDSGGRNPLALVPMWTTVVAALGGLALLMPVVRRPIVAANRHALTVRPGALRTLRLPWADIVEVATSTVGTDAFMLLRYRRPTNPLGDRPGWWDQAVLRAARRIASDDERRRLAGYHLAVRLSEFAGQAEARLGTLAALAPDHVVFTDPR